MQTACIYTCKKGTMTAFNSLPKKYVATIKREEAEPSYGLTKPLGSYSFLWQHFHFILEMLMAFKLAKGWKQKFKIIFGRPDNINPRFRAHLERKWLSKKVMQSPALPLFHFIMVQTLLTLTVLFFTILFEHYLSAIQLCLSALFVLLSVVNTGAMLEQRKWIFNLEYTRLSVAAIFIYSCYPHPLMSIAIFIVMMGTMMYYKSCSSMYRSFVYPGS